MASSCFGVVVQLMPAAGNFLGTEGFAAMGKSLAALTALRKLDLSSEFFFLPLFLGCLSRRMSGV